VAQKSKDSTDPTANWASVMFMGYGKTLRTCHIQ
jgi:hypothetical protein